MKRRCLQRMCVMLLPFAIQCLTILPPSTLEIVAIQHVISQKKKWTCTWKCVINVTKEQFSFGVRGSWRAHLQLCRACVFLVTRFLSITSDNPSQVSRVVVAIETLDLNDNAPELDRQYNTAMCDSASTGQVRGQATC